MIAGNPYENMKVVSNVKMLQNGSSETSHYGKNQQHGFYSNLQDFTFHFHKEKKNLGNLTFRNLASYI